MTRTWPVARVPWRAIGIRIAWSFGDYYTRTGLDLRMRELVTLSILIALGGADAQVKGHIRGNVNMGTGRRVLVDVITQLLPWVGYPRTLNALAALDEVVPEQA